MIGCPDDAQLQAMLAGRLPPEDAGPLDEHLAACGNCLARLETLSDDPQWDRWRIAWAEAHMAPRNKSATRK